MRPRIAIAILLLTACVSCGGGSGSSDDPAPSVSVSTPTPTPSPTDSERPTPTPIPTEVVLAPMRAWSVGYLRDAGSSEPPQAVLRSDDGGETWDVIRRSNRRLGAIAFHDRERGILGSDGGVVLRTDDGGDTWLEARAVTGNADVYFADAAFLGAQTATVVGVELDPVRGTAVRPVLTRTTDGGATWSDAAILGDGQVAVSTISLAQVCFSANGIGVAVGVGEVAPGTFEVGISALVVLIGNADGSVWTDVTRRLGLGVPTAAIVYTLACNPDGTLWLAGARAPRLLQSVEPLQLVSHDDGATWAEEPFVSEFSPGGGFLIGDIAFGEGGAGWALSAPLASSEALLLFHTADGGRSWRQQQRPPIEPGLPQAYLAVADGERSIVAGDANAFPDFEPNGPNFRPFVWYTADGGRSPWLAGTLPEDVLLLQQVTVATDRQ